MNGILSNNRVTTLVVIGFLVDTLTTYVVHLTTYVVKVMLMGPFEIKCQGVSEKNFQATPCVILNGKALTMLTRFLDF